MVLSTADIRCVVDCERTRTMSTDFEIMAATMVEHGVEQLVVQAQQRADNDDEHPSEAS